MKNTKNTEYVICIDIACTEVGIIKKANNRCSTCRTKLLALTIDALNTYYCRNGTLCNNETCNKLHTNVTRKHNSPPYISPCCTGKHCREKKCLFLHPVDGIWSVKI